MHDFKRVTLATLALFGAPAMAQTMETADTKGVDLIRRPGYKVQPVEMMFRDRDGVLVNLLQAGVRE